MKIAFVSPFPVFPATGGNRARTLSMINAVAAMGYDVHFVLLPSRHLGDVDLDAHRDRYGPRFQLLNRPAMAEMRYLAGRALAKARRKVMRSPYRVSSVDEIYFRPFTQQLAAIHALEKFDAVVVQYAEFSAALSAFPNARLIIDTHDSFHGQMPAQEERRGLARAHDVIAIQEDEAATFRRALSGEPARVIVISHLIEPGDCVSTEPCMGATFIGSDFRQNNESLSWFIAEVLPLIRDQEPAFQLRIAGSVGNAVGDAPGVIKLGRVARFEDAFVDSPILVNCITSGTGVKIKLLDAFGAGIPVVSTELGVKGIERRFLAGTRVVADGRADLYAQATLELYRDREARATLSTANRIISQEWNNLQGARLKELLA